MPRLGQQRLFLQLFLQLLWLCWSNDGTSIIQIHQDYIHGKSIEIVTLSPNFFILMFFAAGTFFMVLDRLSHTHTHIQIKSTLTIFYILTQLVLDFGLWFFIFFLQHVSQEFMSKILDTSFEIISVVPRSTSSLLLLAKEMPRLRQEKLFLQLFLQLLWLCWFNDGTSIIQIHQDYMANPLNLSVYHPISSFLCPFLLERSLWS